MSTETAEADELRAIVERLSREIFASLLPHDPENDDKRPSRYTRCDVPLELRVQPVLATNDVGIGDILVLAENDPHSSALRAFTAHDAVMYGRTEFAVVMKTTTKQIIARYVGKPWYDWRADLTEFGKPLIEVDTRLSIGSQSREIGRLGSMEELRAKLAAHPKFAEWQAARAAALEKAEADAAVRKAEEKAREARLAPVKAAVVGLNALTRQTLVTLTLRNDVRAVTEWLEEKDFGRMKVYIAGLNAVGTLADEDQVLALRHLDTIITYAKGEQ